jgi:recombination protein RecT
MANDKAVAKKETIDLVATRVREFTTNKELNLPANYSVENAMKSAWLILQGLETRDKKPVLEACTKESIANSLLDMVVQGLNPAKKQVYFIPYGNQLSCQRSYFGAMAVTKAVSGAKEIYAQVVYKKDEFEFEIFRGSRRVTKHVQKLENINPAEIVAAYCVIEIDDNPDHNITDIMSIEQIKKSWAKGKMGSGTQNDFSEEMAKRTVINRACKPIINMSNDNHLLMETFERIDSASDEKSAVEEIAEHANSETIDIIAEPIVEEAKKTTKTAVVETVAAEIVEEDPF